jgi:hypothetical protein
LAAHRKIRATTVSGRGSGVDCLEGGVPAMEDVLGLVDLAFDEESDGFLNLVSASAQSVNCGSSQSIGC